MHPVSTCHQGISIYDLPSEVLEEIFVECLPTFPALSPEVAPLLLCSVCRLWRNVALFSTRLWSRISMNMFDLVSRNPGCDGPTLCAIDFLQRAKVQPLSIQLKASSPVVLDHPEFAARFKFFLDQFHDRIQTLDLSSSWLSRLLYSIPQETRFPQLVNIAITSSNSNSFDTISTPLAIFTGSSLLREVTYSAYLSQETISNLAIPWGQLTHLTLTDVDYTAWCYIFMRCTNLRSGAFTISGTPPPTQKSAVDIIFPSLTHLSIHSNQSSRSPLSLMSFCFPNLKGLKLGWNNSPGFDISFLSTIRNLESLAISSPQFDFINMGEILSIISLTPSVSEFHVTNDHCSSELFDALTYHPHHQHPLLPRLQTLLVDTSNWSSMCDQAQVFNRLERMVASRWWICPESKVNRLEVLQMTTAERSVERVKGVLQQLTDAGLHLTLSSCASARCDEGRGRHDWYTSERSQPVA